MAQPLCCLQADLDRWLTDDAGVYRFETGNFIRWAHTNKLTAGHLTSIRWDGPAQLLDDQHRWDTARRLLRDHALKPEDRLAGLLVLLYAQGTTAISRMIPQQIHTDDQDVRLRLGRVPIQLSEPVATLARRRGQPQRPRDHRSRHSISLAVPRRPTRPADQHSTTDPPAQRSRDPAQPDSQHVQRRPDHLLRCPAHQAPPAISSTAPTTCVLTCTTAQRVLASRAEANELQPDIHQLVATMALQLVSPWPVLHTVVVTRGPHRPHDPCLHRPPNYRRQNDQGD
ncbi:MAG: hypothetical protein ACRDST_21950 [Pseudonocardiaceae bacterium]